MTQLKEITINQKVIDFLQSIGITELFPTQKEAFDTGVLDGRNLVLAVPTSSGKTLVAEICMLKSILSGRGTALYLVPLKSLAHEKYTEFKKYESLGITTTMSVGDYDSPGKNLRDADIVVVTTERADSLIRHKVDWIDQIGVIVADEVHLVNDPSRGPTLEMVLAKLIQAIPNVQVIALSATISNADVIADWLNAELVKSSWRPVPLNEGVYHKAKLTFTDRSTRSIRRTRKEEIADIVCDILDEDGQVLIFVSSRRSTVSVAKKVAQFIRPYLTEKELSSLNTIATRIGGGQSVPETSKTLAKLMTMGAAFHHAGLSNLERTAVEDCFKKNQLKLIVATPTLAAGVNLPARRVIIRDYRRFEQGRGNYPIPVLEYKQMAGRAGRPKYDKYGEAVLIARTEQELDFLVDHYILSEPEEITSKLASPRAIRSHLLAAIASDLTSNREEIDKLIDGTFFSHQYDTIEIEDHISSTLTFLETGELIKSDSGEFAATPLGQRTSRLYINPETALMFRDVFTESENPSIPSILHLICHTPDQPVTYVTRSEVEDFEALLDSEQEHFLVDSPDSWIDPDGYMTFLGEIKTAQMLYDWISEQTEKDLTDNYRVGVGDIHRYVQSAEWLLYAAFEITRIIGAGQILPELRKLRLRMKYGVKSELLELVGLRGIGRVRGRMLYSYGLESLSDLFTVNIIELARIPTIGTSLAKSIKQQLGVDIDEIDDIGIESPQSDESSPESFQMSLDDFDS